MWRVVSEPFRNAALIFPTKQRAVKSMVDVCKEDKNVKRLIIFGSSVTAACHIWSDIDAYFEIEHEVDNLPLTGTDNQAWDRWSNFTVDNQLKEEILQTGVVVYDRAEKELLGFCPKANYGSKNPTQTQNGRRVFRQQFRRIPSSARIWGQIKSKDE